MSGEANGRELLRVTGLHAFYGESHILHGVDFRVHAGECVTLLGRNGSGRTTTLKAIIGLVDRRTGSVMVNGRETVEMPTHRIVHLGVGYCPEERGIFATLSAEENLTLPPVVRSGGMSVLEIYELFPNLAERRRSQGSRLSGGEQQMLALARILRTGARLLLLDEPTQGMGHEDVGRVVALIQRVAQGRTVLMVEHNLSVVQDLATRVTVLARGQVLAEGTYAEVSHDPAVLEAYIGAPA